MTKMHCFLSLTLNITDTNTTDCVLCISLRRVGPATDKNWVLGFIFIALNVKRKKKQQWKTIGISPSFETYWICKPDDEVEMRNGSCRDGNGSDNIMGMTTLFSHRKPSDGEKYKQAGLISRVKCGTLMWKRQKKTGAISSLCSGDEGPGEVLMRGVDALQRPLTDRRTLFIRCLLFIELKCSLSERLCFSLCWFELFLLFGLVRKLPFGDVQVALAVLPFFILLPLPLSACLQYEETEELPTPLGLASHSLLVLAREEGGY